MISRTQIYNFLGTMGFSFRKKLMGENAIAKMEDLNNRRDICFSCEFKIGKSKQYFRYTSCYCYINTKTIFTTSECPEGKWKTLDY